MQITLGEKHFKNSKEGVAFRTIVHGNAFHCERNVIFQQQNLLAIAI